MKIKIGKYNLSSGPNDFVISETKKVEKSDNPENIGVEVETNHTYHPTIASAINNVFKRGLLKSQATTLTDLLNEVKEQRRELQELFEHTVKG